MSLFSHLPQKSLQINLTPKGSFVKILGLQRKEPQYVVPDERRIMSSSYGQKATYNVEKKPLEDASPSKDKPNQTLKGPFIFFPLFREK